MRKIIAALASAALAVSLLASPASAAPATVSATVAQPGQSITDPSGKVHKVGKTTGQGKVSAKPSPRIGAGSSKLLAATYFYNTGYQYPGCAGTPSVCGSEGVRAQHPILEPYLDTTAGDFHSLQQIWAQSADGQQAVETGWVVSQNVNGDLDPHLFVYARKNGVSPTGWNGSFTLIASPPFTPGQNLDSLKGTGNKDFLIRFFDGVWWVGFDNLWYGYFNPTTAGLWAASPAISPAFQRVGLGQTGGEVLANSSAPCTDMGNGLKGKVSGAPNTSASRSWNWTLLAPPSGVANNLTLQAPTNSTYYDHILNTGSIRSEYLGGGGAC